MALGTPTYMSPEQALGERTIDARSDIYALGCVLYEMLVGDPPHKASSLQALVAKILTERPTPVAVTRDTVPLAVQQALETALAKLPADRFSTAAEFAAALEATTVATVATPTVVARWTLVDAADGQLGVRGRVCAPPAGPHQGGRPRCARGVRHRASRWRTARA
jgi:serine/threonine protein kinase